MGKTKTQAPAKGKTQIRVAAKDQPSDATRMQWPAFFKTKQPMASNSIHWHLPDQIGVIHNFLTPAECTTIIETCLKHIDMIPSPPPRRGEAKRTNDRYAVNDHEFSQTLWRLLAPTVSEFVGSEKGIKGARATGMNSDIRVYRYGPGQIFQPHYDGSALDRTTGKQSEWTFLLYLTGAEDGVQDGETAFYKNHTYRPDKELLVPLERGAVCLHRHGNACMLHEARPPTAGTKWVLRSDVTFG